MNLGLHVLLLTSYFLYENMRKSNILIPKKLHISDVVKQVDSAVEVVIDL